MAPLNKRQIKYLESLTSQQLYDLIYNKSKDSYEKKIDPDFPRYPKGYNTADSTEAENIMNEEKYQVLAKKGFEDLVGKLDTIKDNRERLLSTVSGAVQQGTIDIGIPNQGPISELASRGKNVSDPTSIDGRSIIDPIIGGEGLENDLLAFDKMEFGGEALGGPVREKAAGISPERTTTGGDLALGEEAEIDDIPFSTGDVQRSIIDKGLVATKTDPASTETYADRKAAARESQTDYLDKLFAKYSKITAQQGVTSSAANLMNTMTSIFATKKALEAVGETPEISVPGKDVVKLHRPDVKTEFDIYANRLVNTGLKQSREMGRPELIPSILYQGAQVGQKGILEQGKIDTQISNQQAMIDLQIVDAFKGRQMQAEGIEFETEAQKANARAGLYSQFGQYLKQSFSAQADIMNKTLINPISTSLDWFDRYGYQKEGIYNTSIT